METTDPQAGRSPPPVEQPPRISPIHSATRSSALKAEFKARIEDIQRRRDQASAAMSDRLYALIVEYKQADQSFVDQHTECLNELSARVPDAADTCEWAKPCIGVPEREYFAQEGVAFNFHPSSDRYGLGLDHQSPPAQPYALPTGQVMSRAVPNEQPRAASSPSPPTSALSSAPSSPKWAHELEDGTQRIFPEPSIPWSPTSKPASDNPTLLPGKRRAGPPSSDEEPTSDAPPPLRPKPKRPREMLHVRTSRKPLPTSGRARPADRPSSTYTSQPTASPSRPTNPSPALPYHTTQPKPPVQKKSYQGPRCVECSKRSQRCDRELPCSVCVQKNRIGRCRYLQQRTAK